jgi:hypothetical protein
VQGHGHGTGWRHAGLDPCSRLSSRRDDWPCTPPAPLPCRRKRAMCAACTKRWGSLQTQINSWAQEVAGNAANARGRGSGVELQQLLGMSKAEILQLFAHQVQ